MYTWGGIRQQAPMGTQRHYSTQPMDKMTKAAILQLPGKLLNIQPEKRFHNPNFVNTHEPKRTGHLYETCCSFISGSTGYPNNLRKESAPVDIKPEMRREHKRPPAREVWHKQPTISMDIIVDEVGTDACEEPGCAKPSPRFATLGEFIGSPERIAEAVGEEIVIKLPNSPLCIAIGTPVCFSISPPKPFGRQRAPSECGSVDSYITFGDCGSSGDESSEWEDDDDDESDSDSNSIDFISTTKTDDDADTSGTVKKVRFARGKDLAEVHHMLAWNFAYRASRKGCWEQCARDRERFRRRIEESDRTLGGVLGAEHRRRIYEDRFEADS